jgi:outer membrane protein assembly factor BamB
LPDDTPMVNGPLRTFAQVGGNLWVGGNFTQVKDPNGTVVDNVSNVAVFDLTTGAYKPGIAPSLGAGATDSKVTEIKTYGGNVLIGGKFAGPDNLKNLVALNGTTGDLVRWYTAPILESVLAAPDLGRVYGTKRPCLSPCRLASLPAV